jgi:hypothetical protein
MAMLAASDAEMGGVIIGAHYSGWAF